MAKQEKKIASKKKFFAVSIPLLNMDITVLGFSQDEIMGKTIKLDLTRILRGKNFETTLTIKKEDQKLVGEFKSLRLLQSYMARLMRKSISYIEDSFLCKSKDTQLRIKPFMLTRKKVHRSIRKALRSKAKELIIQFAAENSSDAVFSSIIKASLQKELASKLKKIYPLSLCEIRAIKKE